MHFLGPEPAFPVSKKIVTGAIDNLVRTRHESRWQSMPECRQAKCFIQVPRRSNRRLCSGLTRGLIRILTQVVTGHCLLALHLYTIGTGNSPTCPLSKQEDEDHFVAWCEAFSEAREYRKVPGLLEL